MDYLKSIISYKGKKYEELTGPKEVADVESIVQLLQPFAQEMQQHPQGRIAVTKQGFPVVSSFPPELAARIAAHLNQVY